MNYRTTTLPKSEIEIRTEISPEEMGRFYASALKQAAADAEIDGFRKGKAPTQIVEKKAGEFSLLERASVLAIEKTYPKILNELKEKLGDEFEPIGAPNIEITKLARGVPLEYTALLVVLPSLPLPDYKKIANAVLAEKKTPEVTEKEIEGSLEWLQKSRAKLVTVSRPSIKGDRVEIDFEAKCGIIALAGGHSRSHPVIIGEEQFMPGFEEHLVGMRESETKAFSLVAPVNYVEKTLAGKMIDFTVTMRLVQERILPELTDEFAGTLGKFEGLEGLKKSIREGLASEKEGKERERIRIKTVEAIAEKTSTEIPDLLIGRELEKMVQELRSSIEQMGVTWSDYMANIKKSEEELKKEWRKDAERRVKIALILRKIARVENIRPSAEEIQEATNQNVARLGINEERFSAKGGTTSGGKKIDRSAFLEYNTTVARSEKVFRFLENLG